MSELRKTTFSRKAVTRSELPYSNYVNLDGKEDAGGQEEGRLPHGLAGEHGARVGGPSQQRHVEPTCKKRVFVLVKTA